LRRRLLYAGRRACGVRRSPRIAPRTRRTRQSRGDACRLRGHVFRSTRAASTSGQEVVTPSIAGMGWSLGAWPGQGPAGKI